MTIHGPYDTNPLEWNWRWLDRGDGPELRAVEP